jgi:hypothetical protein
MAYTGLTATIPANFLQGTLKLGQTWGSAEIPTNLQIPSLPSVQIQFWTGTGSQLGRANLLNFASGTLTNVTPGTTDTADIDLAAWDDFLGTSKNFAEVVLLAVLNFATTDGSTLIFGGTSATPATNPWVAIFADMATPNLGRIRIPPGFVHPTNNQTIPGILLISGGNLATFATSGTDKVLRLYTAAASVPYRIVAVGRDAAS